jgi:uncharacterized membrane protein YgcG
MKPIRIGRAERLRTLRPRDNCRHWTFVALVALLVCVVALFSAPAVVADEATPQAAGEKSWAIDSLTAIASVQDNGDVVMDETFTYTFTGNYHFVERNVPLDNSEGIADIEVRDASGVALTSSETDNAGTFRSYKEGTTEWIRANFDLTDASATYTFHYRLKAGVLFGSKEDYLTWYVLGADVESRIGRVQATVQLPGAVPSESLTHEFDVGYGVEPLAYSPGPSTMVYEATNVNAYTHFWAKTGFPKGIVIYHWTAHRVLSFIVPKLGFLLPMLTFLTVLLIWMRIGRDPGAQVYAKYVDQPPSALPPGLVGALVDEKVDTKEVIATIVDLARRGYLEMTDGKVEGKSGTVFTRLKPFDDLRGFEKMVADSLFDEGHPDQVTTSDLRNHFYVRVGPIVNQVYKDVTAVGLFRKDPKKTRSRWVGYGVLMVVVTVALRFILKSLHFDGYDWIMAGGVCSAIVMWIFSSRMPGRTARGAREQKKWEAFREYLKDLARFQDMETAREKFDACLPYAIALGVERQWARRFEDLTVPPPTWYHPPVIIADGHPGPISTGIPGGLGGGTHHTGGGGFSLDDVSNSLFGALGKMSSVLTSAPSSGGSGHGGWSSGGFGGGFSGGGFSGGVGGGGMRAG